MAMPGLILMKMSRGCKVPLGCIVLKPRRRSLPEEVHGHLPPGSLSWEGGPPSVWPSAWQYVAFSQRPGFKCKDTSVCPPITLLRRNLWNYLNDWIVSKINRPQFSRLGWWWGEGQGAGAENPLNWILTSLNLISRHQDPGDQLSFTFPDWLWSLLLCFMKLNSIKIDKWAL